MLAAAALLAGVLPFFIPFSRFITTSAVSDTFALLPWWWVQDHFIHLQQVKWAALGVSLAAGALFVLLPRRYALLLPVLVAAYFVATSFVVENGRHGLHETSVGSLWAGTHETHPDWIDRAVGRDASVVVLWTGMTTPYPIWENEFFNRSLGTVYDLDGAGPPDPLPQTAVRPVPRRRARPSSGGRPVEAQYVLAPGTVELAGKLLVSDPVGVDLYRVNGPIVILATSAASTRTTRGPEPHRHLPAGRVHRREARGDAAGRRPPLHPAADGRRDRGRRRRRQVSIPVDGETTLTRAAAAPARPDVCTVRFTVGRTLVPARVEPGSIDTRPLGAHYLDFRPLP